MLRLRRPLAVTPPFISGSVAQTQDDNSVSSTASLPGSRISVQQPSARNPGVVFTAAGAVKSQSTTSLVRNKYTQSYYSTVSLFPGDKQPRIVLSSSNTNYYLNTRGSKLGRNGNTVILPEDSGGQVWRSTDGGVSFTTVGSAPMTGVRHLCYTSNAVWVTVNYISEIHRSTNDGVTWSLVSTGVAGLTTARYADYCNGYLLVTQSTASTTAAKSSDAGATWSSVTLPIAAGQCQTLNNQITVWNSGGTQIARATANDLTSWETITAPTTVSYVGYGGGKYIYTTVVGGVTYVYQSFDFQNWSLLWSVSGDNALGEIVYDKWSKNFLFGTSTTYAGFNSFTAIAGGRSCTPCSAEDTSISLVNIIGNTTPGDLRIFIIRDPSDVTVTY